jgi:hypothetical protein
MGTIASLLFGRDAGRLLDLITGETSREREMADRVARSGEWCGSTPGRGRSDLRADRADGLTPPSFPFGGFDARLT